MKNEPKGSIVQHDNPDSPANPGDFPFISDFEGIHSDVNPHANPQKNDTSIKERLAHRRCIAFLLNPNNKIIKNGTAIAHSNLCGEHGTENNDPYDSALLELVNVGMFKQTPGGFEWADDYQVVPKFFFMMGLNDQREIFIDYLLENKRMKFTEWLVVLTKMTKMDKIKLKDLNRFNRKKISQAIQGFRR